MSRLATLLLGLFVANAATAKTSTPALRARARVALERIERVTGQAAKVVWREGRRAPLLVTGRLSRPSAGLPSDLARTFLQAHPELLRAPVAELAEKIVLRGPGVSVVRYLQRHEGLPVFNASAAVTVADDGVVRTVTGSTFAVPPQDLRPTLDAAAALRAAYNHVPIAGYTSDTRAATLGLYALPSSTALVYRVELPAVPALLLAPTLYLDAHDGRLVRRESRIRFAKQGHVYLANPIENDTVQTVTLQVPDNATTLENESVKTVNCLDHHERLAVNFQGFNAQIHVCSEVPKASTSAELNYDFLYDPAEDGTEAANEDAFAEVQMHYHVNAIYDYFRGFGLTTLISSLGGSNQIRATVNFRIPIDLSDLSNLIGAFAQAQDANGPLFPFDNAFFLAAEEASLFFTRDVDSMVFGQGTATDFSYDGDVVYHEFTHAVVRSTSNLVSIAVDPFGLDDAPGAMNEGLADYFSSVFAGDPEVGEWAGQSLPEAQASGAIRTLTNTKTCPANLWGEVHHDSEAFSGGLWQARSSLAEGDRTTFDAAVYAAMIGLASDSSFEAAATSIVSEVSSRLNPTVAASLQTILENRGLMGCNNRIIAATTHDRLFIQGTGGAGISPYVPGPAQFQIEVPAGKNAVRVRYVPSANILDPQAGAGLFASPDVRVIGVGSDPIVFIYEGNTIGNTADFTQATFADTGVDAGDGSGATIWEARLDGVPPGTYYVMLVNAGQGQASVRTISLEAITASTGNDGGTDGGVSGNDGGPGTPDAGVGNDGGTGQPPAQASGGCAVGGGGAPEVLFALALLIGVALLRRRRRV